MNDYTYRRFESHQAILDYIQADGYMDAGNPGVCFAFSLTERSNSDYSLEIVFNDKEEEGDAQMIPS